MGSFDPTSTRFLSNAFFASLRIGIESMPIGLRLLTALNEATLLREYRRFAGLFNAEFSSFERKRFVNLSHAANKAMNLNSYLGLMGRSWRVSYRGNNAYLEPSAEERADLSFPDSKYVLTLDADSILLNDYVLRLVECDGSPGQRAAGGCSNPLQCLSGCDEFP